MKNPAINRASLNRLTDWCRCGRLNASKQLQPAMTFQVYTKSIKRRKQMLWSVFNRTFKSGVNRMCDTGKAICAIRAVGVPKLRLDVGLMNTPEFIRAWWDTIKSS